MHRICADSSDSHIAACKISLKYLAIVALFFIPAQSQVTGTVIVFEVTPRGFFIAADSRGVFKNGVHKDDQCKITALNNNLVFAVSAGAYYPASPNDFVASWNAIREAKDLAITIPLSPTDSAETFIPSLADKWAQLMVKHWTAMNTWHPDKVEDAIRHNDGSLTNGIFAAAINGHVSVVVRKIYSDAGTIMFSTIPVGQLCSINTPCASGVLNIFNEFLFPNTARAKREQLKASPELLANMDRSLIETIRLVDVSIAYDTSGMIGGPVDALQMKTGGGITWFQRKANCPEEYR